MEPQKRASSDFPDPFGTVPGKLGNPQASTGSTQRFAERCLPGGPPRERAGWEVPVVGLSNPE